MDLAIPLFESALKGREERLGWNHIHTIGSRTELASTYIQSGKPELAIPLLERNLKACKEAKLEDLKEGYHLIATVHGDHGVIKIVAHSKEK